VKEAGVSHLIGGYTELGWTALKAILLFTVAVIGLRLSERRMLAEFNVFDFAVAVAVGAIIGRTATSSNTSFATGLIALVTLLVAHRLVAVLRRGGLLAGLLDRRPLVLVAQGRMQPPALRSAGLTQRDVYRLLRQAGQADLDDLQYVLYEEHGGITVVRADRPRGEAIRIGLVEAGIDDAL
jgi:uncharacterized membrane protein YcaP (DUF421 family)